jgi:hypothetical protein
MKENIGCVSQTPSKMKSSTWHTEKDIWASIALGRRCGATSYPGLPEAIVMRSLISGLTRAQFDAAADLLVDSSNLAVRKWARHKSLDGVRSGICAAYSKMSRGIWASLDITTNLVEASRFSPPDKSGRKNPRSSCGSNQQH